MRHHSSIGKHNKHAVLSAPQADDKLAAEQATALEKGIDGAWRKRIEQGDPFEKLLQKDKVRRQFETLSTAASSLLAVPLLSQHQVFEPNRLPWNAYGRPRLAT